MCHVLERASGFAPLPAGAPVRHGLARVVSSTCSTANGSHDIFLTRSHETSANSPIRNSDAMPGCRGENFCNGDESCFVDVVACALGPQLVLYCRMRCHRHQQTSELDAVPTVTLRSGLAPRPR
jgi:hypothetical protein